MAPRNAEATPAMRKPMTSVGTAPSRVMKSEPGSAAIANRTIGRPERMPTSVPDRRRSDWIDKMTGGTARMLSRRPTPASQSRPAATQNSRMALPAAASAVLCSELEHVRHISAAYSVRSPPPCGEGLGWGVVRFLRRWRDHDLAASPPSPTLPHKGGGSRPSSPLALFHFTRINSRRAFEARERFVDLEATRLGFFALLALAFDHILRRAGDEVGIGELGVDARDVGFNARHFLLEARFLGGEVDHPLERQRRHLPAHDELHGPLRRAFRERNIGEAREAAHDVGPPRRSRLR